MCEIAKQGDITVMSVDLTPRELVSKRLSTQDSEDPFFVVTLSKLYGLHQKWINNLPCIKPFYAVKCNPDPFLLSILASLGCGFDCASKSEIKTILEIGVEPSRIVYANPCKQVSHIKYAASCGVKMMTFDNEIELKKMAKHHPSGELLLRIRADDPDAQCNLGVKFGATVAEAFRLLGVAREMNLNVIGVSFHVGSGCQNASAYSKAIEMAHEVFEHGKGLGFKFTVLDIGGGFPGSSSTESLFQEVSTSIKTSLLKYFDNEPGLRVIAEPGRYFAASIHTLAVCVTSKRETVTEQGEKKFMYYLNDGLYGSFNCVLFDHAKPLPQVLPLEKEVKSKAHKSSLWGPTCDGFDQILDDEMLPPLDVGDWLYFEDMGAYTIASATSFNGFTKPICYYYINQCHINRLLPFKVLGSFMQYNKEHIDQVAMTNMSTVQESIPFIRKEVDTC